MKFLWRQNWTDMPIPVEVTHWMPLAPTTATDGERFEAEVVAVAVVEGVVVKITLEDLIPDVVH